MSRENNSYWRNIQLQMTTNIYIFEKKTSPKLKYSIHWTYNSYFIDFVTFYIIWNSLKKRIYGKLTEKRLYTVLAYMCTKVA